MNDSEQALALWGTTVDVLADRTVRAHRLTNAEERRAERLVLGRDRDSFRAAHLLARVCGVLIGLNPDALELRQRCPTCGEAHGVPRFPDAPHVRVSIAHTRGAVVAAVAPMAVGVDIEPIRAVRLAELAPVLSPAEAAWLECNRDDAIRIWCRKEAAVKASEVGISGMRSVNALAGSWIEATADGYQVCIATASSIAVSRIGLARSPEHERRTED